MWETLIDLRRGSNHLFLRYSFAWTPSLIFGPYARLETLSESAALRTVCLLARRRGSECLHSHVTFLGAVTFLCTQTYRLGRQILAHSPRLVGAARPDRIPSMT